jgi:hypothetical protein
MGVIGEMMAGFCMKWVDYCLRTGDIGHPTHHASRPRGSGVNQNRPNRRVFVTRPQAR